MFLEPKPASSGGAGVGHPNPTEQKTFSPDLKLFRSVRTSFPRVNMNRYWPNEAPGSISSIFVSVHPSCTSPTTRILSRYRTPFMVLILVRYLATLCTSIRVGSILKDSTRRRWPSGCDSEHSVLYDRYQRPVYCFGMGSASHASAIFSMVEISLLSSTASWSMPER